MEFNQLNNAELLSSIAGPVPRRSSHCSAVWRKSGSSLTRSKPDDRPQTTEEMIAWDRGGKAKFSPLKIT